MYFSCIYILRIFLVVIFSFVMVRLVDGKKDCASVYLVAGLNTDSYSIIISVLDALVRIIASDIDCAFCVSASVCAL